MKHLAKISLALVLLSTISACAIFSPVSQPQQLCELRDEKTLFFSGNIDEEMLRCAERNLTDEIEKVGVSTFGGSVEVGHKIARLINQRPRTLIIEDYCLSSCGNYFVPASEKVILRPGAFIGLHGTIDPYTIYKNNASMDKLEKIIKDEDKFAADFDVPRGWRIYRPAGYNGGVETPDMTGELRVPTHKRKKIMIVTEPPFLNSCLPQIEFIHEDEPQAIFALGKPIKRINTLGGIGTGSLECKPNTGQGLHP